ncbi:MAG: asparagine synthase (glutamine-hydrolyzing) [Planctomycetota bacterium]|jgi:asparagine synthase (glutamine-hydrolysing)
MCGFVGIFRPNGSEVPKDKINAMLGIISYRGPDDSGQYFAPGIGLGHVRLSIQDISSLAAQPMVSHNKRFVIAYNGEIYNVRELQDELSIKDQVLKSTGDTEALLEYLDIFGIEKTLSKLEGMFAFALWDQQERMLILARDRHGIKPLYYKAGSNGEIIFASEMKALVTSQPEPDLCTINSTLLGLGGTWGEPTAFRGIRHVCAGEWMIFRENVDKKRHSSFHINDFVDQELHNELKKLSKGQIIDRVANELEESVRMRLISDVPVACFVSGGVDSSLITALAAKYYPNLKLYHANVASDSETLAAEHLAKTLGLEMRAVKVTDEDILDYTPIATYYYELPIMYHGGSCVPFYMVSKLAGEDGIKVVLTGEGSDEYFMGYPDLAIRPYLRMYHKTLEFFQNSLHCIPPLGNIIWPRKSDDPSTHLRNLMFRYELEQRRGEAAEAFHFVHNKTDLDWHVMCIDGVIGNVRTLLQRNDRLAMAWGLESRFPFLGSNVAKTAVNMPNQYKIRKTLGSHDWRHCLISDKWVVRKIAERYLPQKLANRSKFGFRSSVYRRLKIDKRFFYKGFIAEYYGLNNRAIDHLVESATANWLSQVLCVEVWGQIFPLRWSVDASREHLKQYVSINQT